MLPIRGGMIFKLIPCQIGSFHPKNLKNVHRNWNPRGYRYSFPGLQKKISTPAQEPEDCLPFTAGSSFSFTTACKIAAWLTLCG